MKVAFLTFGFMKVALPPWEGLKVAFMNRGFMKVAFMYLAGMTGLALEVRLRRRLRGERPQVQQGLRRELFSFDGGLTERDASAVSS